MNPLNISGYTIRELNSKLRAEYNRPKNGRSRKVYIDKKQQIVFKLPIVGNSYNEQEYKNYRLFTENKANSVRNLIVPIAESWLFYTTDGVAVLVMKLVTPLKPIITSELPEWAKNGNVDTYQIGYCESQLVAFDHTSFI